MAISVNGFIAKSNHETPWSDAEFASYSEKVKEIGNLIIGKTTYDLMYEEKTFTGLHEPFVAVLTSSVDKPQRKKTVYVNNFENALKELEKKGFDTALVGGGSKLNTAALKSGKINEIYIDIEPFVFGQGIPLFAPTDREIALKLIYTKRIGDSGIQLHYKVI